TTGIAQKRHAPAPENRAGYPENRLRGRDDGHADLVLLAARACLAAGADGSIVEVPPTMGRNLYG
ncbi:MAG: hypothetical protein D6694_13965, partial [Gammaproteobacteria bacterium]